MLHGMSLPLLFAGALALVAAAVHGGAGQVLVLRRISPEMLPPTPFGGPGLTKAMIDVSWHMGTIGLAAVGIGLLLSGSVLDAGAAEGISLLCAATSTGFAALALGLGARTQPIRAALQHPGPPLLTAIAVLAWWGAL
jgi:hypothetical protein